MRTPRVLLVRVGAMGDVLHALPAVAALRREWPHAVIDWVADPRWAPLLVDAAGRGPVVSAVHLAETKAWSRAPVSRTTLRSVLALRKGMQASRPEHVVDVQGTLRSAVIGRIAGSEDLAGFADPREWPALLLYGRTLERRGVHVVEQNAALLGGALGLSLKPVMPELPVDEQAEARMERDFGAAHHSNERIALLAPTAGWGAKQWPAERFGMLAKVLGAMGFRVLVNTADPGERTVLDVLHASDGTATPAPCSVAELVALTRRAALVVGGDTGPVHLAAALGRPLVGLYGPTDPARNGPWGTGPMRMLRRAESATSHKRVVEVDPGLAQIGVGEVVAAIEALLAEA